MFFRAVFAALFVSLSREATSTVSKQNCGVLCWVAGDTLRPRKNERTSATVSS